MEPWEVCRLLTAVRSFTNWPVAHSGSPRDSIVDTHKLIEEHFLFIVSMKIEISDNFYQSESPKFPLRMDIELTHRGNSSSRKVYTLFHERLESPYAVCKIDDVLVNGETRKPMTFPSWWKQKFHYINGGPKNTIGEWPATSDELVKVMEEEYTVLYGDIDHNRHTNYSTYIKFCFDSIFNGVSNLKFKMVGSGNLDRGIKIMEMTFHGETNYRDTLIVELFEDYDKPNCVFCNVRKANHEVKCCSIFFEFYSKVDKQLEGKL